MGNEVSQQNQGGSSSKYGAKLENDVKVTWKLGCKDSEFAPRDGHCACSINKKLYIFGGVAQTPAGDSRESNALLIFDSETQKWGRSASKGSVPKPRSAATMCAIGDKIYLFGGLSQDSGWTNDLHVYDTASEEWKKLSPEGSSPAPRDKVASAVVDNKMYVFGGFGPQGTEEDSGAEEEDEEENDLPQDQEGAQFGWFNDLRVYDPQSNTWTEPMQMNIAKPSPRAAMGMCAIHKHLVIFGGRDLAGRCNDFHVFNTETRRWETEWLKETKGRQPAPRSFHSCTAVGNRVVVFGGRGISEEHFDSIDIYDTATKQWLQPEELGERPAGRGLHTATLVDDEIVIFGGSSEFHPELGQCIKYFNDIHSVPADDLVKGGALETAEEDQENVSTNIPQENNVPGKPETQETTTQESSDMAH